MVVQHLRVLPGQQRGVRQERLILGGRELRGHALLVRRGRGGVGPARVQEVLGDSAQVVRSGGKDQGARCNALEGNQWKTNGNQVCSDVGRPLNSS